MRLNQITDKQSLEELPKNSLYQKKYLIKKPWAKYRSYMFNRCRINPYYNGKLRKINILITMKDMENIWYRDKAFLMKRPSIHRIDTNKDYTIENCKFIEFEEHMKLPRFFNVKGLAKKHTAQQDLNIKKALIKKYKEYCKNGHKRTEENTYITPEGWRDCRECRRIKDRKRAIKIRENQWITVRNGDV